MVGKSQRRMQRWKKMKIKGEFWKFMNFGDEICSFWVFFKIMMNMVKDDEKTQ